MAWGTCKFCREKFVWAQMPAGNWLPMDPETGEKHVCVSPSPPKPEPQESWQVGFHPAGVLVGDIVEQSLAQKAGLQSGDIIIAANGEDVRDMEEFCRIRDAVAPGDQLALRVRCGNRVFEINVQRPAS